MGDQANLEDEMSRFEQEILGAQQPLVAAAPALVIGANTFSSVQEQLASLRAQVYKGNNTRQPAPSNISTGPSPRPTSALTAPPRPPGFTVNGAPPRPAGPHHPGSSNPSVTQPLSRPPVPPGMTPRPFIPSQLRPRGPDPRQQRPPMYRPQVMPGMRPPPPGMMPGMPNGMGPMGPHGPMHTSLSGGPVQYSNQPRFEGPKVVYSSKPVLNKPVAANKDISSAAANTNSDKSGPSGKKREAADAAGIDGVSTSSDPSYSQNMGGDSHQPPNKKDKKNKQKQQQQQSDKKRVFIRTAANDVWEDTSLADWDPNDFRVFCGDLGNEVTDEKLAEAFKAYPSLQKTKVIRDRRTHKTKGFGFISFSDPVDYTRAMREMNGKYVGNRPIKLRKSNWRDRNMEVVKKKEREKKRLGFR